MYRIELTKQAERQLAKLPRTAQIAIRDKIDTLEENPRPDGTKKLTGSLRTYRAKVRQIYRIIYEIQDDRLVVLVVKVGHRKDVYR